MATIKQYQDFILKNIHKEDLETIKTHGFKAFEGGITGFIYYHELIEIYTKWFDVIEEILDEHGYVEKRLFGYYPLCLIANDRVWYATYFSLLQFFDK